MRRAGRTNVSHRRCRSGTEVSLKLDLAKTTSSVTVAPTYPTADLTTTTQTVEEKTIDDRPIRTSNSRRFFLLFPVLSEVRTDESI